MASIGGESDVPPFLIWLKMLLKLISHYMKLSMVVGSIPWGSDYSFFKFKLHLAMYCKTRRKMENEVS